MATERNSNRQNSKVKDDSANSSVSSVIITTFMFLGAGIFVLLNFLTGAVPGGFIGGLIGSAVGFVIGIVLAGIVSLFK